MNEQNNITDFPKDEKEVEKSPEMTPEEIEAAQAQAEIDIEKSRKSHLVGIAFNMNEIRSSFQQSIVESLVAKPSKTKSLCEDYLAWVECEKSAPPVDFSEVSEEVIGVVARYAKTLKSNSLVGRTSFQRSIHNALSSQSSTAKGLCKSYQIWSDAECEAEYIVLAIANSVDLSEVSE